MIDRVGDFWTSMQGAPLVVLTDFDFTISEVDVGDLITAELAPPSPLTRERFERKEIGTRGYWLDSIIRADQREAERLAETVRIDPNFAGFAAWCKEQRIPIAVVSDGFGYYIHRILDREGLHGLPIFCNEVEGPQKLSFPHGNAVCDFCGCCKASVARRVRQQGANIVYIGDGVSDLYASGFADWVFAKGRLARHMHEHGSPYYPLDSFATVTETLSAQLPAFRDGTAPGRAALSPDPRCHFQ